MGDVHQLRAVKSEPLRLAAVACRGGHEAEVVRVRWSRPLTDSEFSFFMDVCARTAPLMDGQ